MADPHKLSARLSQRVTPAFSLLTGDTSTLVDSELTADTSRGRYVHSQDQDQDSDTHYEEYVPIIGFDADYTNSDDLTFPGFRPMRHYLTGEPAQYLLCERRWSKEGDPSSTVGQKNVIIIFVCIATIEECLVDEESGEMLSVTVPFGALMDVLGMRDRPTGRRRRPVFLQTIRDAFVKSRSQEIRQHLDNGNRSPPEPSDLSRLGKMLLDVMDRHIAFQLIKKPLTRLCEKMPFDTLLGLRLIQIKKYLHNKRIEECFKTFVPTIPADEQIPWPRGGMAAAWEAAQARLTADQSNLAIDSKLSKNPEHSQSTKPDVPAGAQKPSGLKSIFSIPGIPADGPLLSLPIAPNSLAGHPDHGHPDALSGLQLFKTAACQVHRVIRSSRDNIYFRDFIGRVEHDVQEFHAGLRVGPALPTAGPGNATGILGSELDVLLERQHIRSLMRIGLGMIQNQWNEKYLTNNFRQKILADIMEELRKIEEAADQVCSAEA